MEKMDPVVHFEMPIEDGKRVADFYSKAFGWKTQQLGEENSNYILVTTTETDDKGMVKKTGAINGGFYPKKDNFPAQYPSVVIAVDNIEESMKKIKDAGGRVLDKPVEIPGYGMYVSFLDTEGNRISMMEPFMDEKGNKKG